MSKISVIMPVYNGEKDLFEAMESVLKQSFEDFEFIIIDDGSLDSSVSIIKSFDDKRIVLLQNNHDFVESLNLGLTYATGKYIARMDADDIMHIDRLTVQHAIMEEEPEITVCASWVSAFGDTTTRGIIPSVSGIIEDPLNKLMLNNFVFHPTVMINKCFLTAHNLQYENYAYAEDYKLWVEIAKCGGVFYVESQPLLYYRSSNMQISKIKVKEQMETAFKIKREIISFLIKQCTSEQESLQKIFDNLLHIESKDMIALDKITQLFYAIFLKTINK